MVVGESGLGKSTLINSLFLTDLYSTEYPGPSHRIKKTVQVEQSKVLIKEGGVQLLLTIVDTPGFGDAVDNSNCWQPVIDHIDSKFEDYLNAESRVNRRQMPDNRVHCCLYFIAPSGHGATKRPSSPKEQRSSAISPPKKCCSKSAHGRGSRERDMPAKPAAAVGKTSASAVQPSPSQVTMPPMTRGAQPVRDDDDDAEEYTEAPADDTNADAVLRRISSSLNINIQTSTKEDDFLSIINARGKKAFEWFPFYKAVWKSIESIWERSASATTCFPRANKLYRVPTSQKDHLFKLPKLDTILATATAAASSRPSASDHADKKVDTFLKRSYTASTCGMCIRNYQVYAVQYQHKLWGCDAIDTYARTVASVVAARRCIQMKTLAPTPDTQSRILELPFQGDLLFGTGVRLFVPDKDDLVLFNRDERLKPLDIEFMKRLHEKVNIIPLIAKADTLTPEECQQFKKQDRLPLAVVGSNTVIEVSGKRVRGRQYPWGVAEVENSEHCDFTILRNMLIRTHMQDLKDVTNNVHYENYRSRKLAAVTYNGVDNNRNKGQLTKTHMQDLKDVTNNVHYENYRSRKLAAVTYKVKYKLCLTICTLRTADLFVMKFVENSEHCDFTILRNMLIRTHMQDLKDVTNNVHYENYRSRKLAAVTYNGVDNNRNKGQLTKSPLAQMEEERREHVTKMKKMEMEMEQVFDMKVKEKIQKLKDSEAELQRRHEQMKKNLEAQHKELEEKRRQYEDEKVNWEAQQRILEQQKLDSSRTLEKNKKKGKIF
ncbi:UNVERIFIED_CONTAM: hypothetical protein FKN15_074131 [Acipenser sinensis]